MKKILVMLAALTLAACILDAPQPSPGEAIISGTWSAYTIRADGQEFDTHPIGVKGIAAPVQIIEHDGHWYTWAPGYGNRIEKISAGGGAIE